MTVRLSLDAELRQLSALANAGYSIGLHIRFTTPLLSFNTYDSRWMEYYADNGYAMRDPMVAWGFSDTGFIRWSDVALPDPFGILVHAGRHGLKFGCSVACGPIRSRSVGSFARDDRQFTDHELETLFEIVQRMHEMSKPPGELTRAQVQALQCIASGDRHTAAAAKLGISESALKARVNSARIRLMARTTVEAIQRAKDYQLI